MFQIKIIKKNQNIYDNKYKQLEILGNGRFANVFKAENISETSSNL
jgi:hypothetical protein